MNFTYAARVFEPTEEYTLEGVTMQSGNLEYHFDTDRIFLRTPPVKQEVTYINPKMTSFLDLADSTMSIRGSGLDHFNKYSKIELLQFKTAREQYIRIPPDKITLKKDDQDWFFEHVFAVQESAFFDRYSE